MTNTPDVPVAFSGAVITIDGPAGSGKSTTARLLAARLGFAYLDTGAMYRAAAWLADRMKTDLEDDTQVAALLDALNLRMEPAADGGRVFHGDEEITQAIRTPLVDRLVTPVSAHPAVRARLAGWQRARAASGSVVLEGRDTGSVVCPDADVKIYLDASLETRAGRRLAERKGGPGAESLSEIAADIDRRDRADAERKHSPLRCPDGAVVIDTSALTIPEQVEAAYQACVRRLGGRG